MLPNDALVLLFSHTETCISDLRLFRILEERLLFLKEKKKVEDVEFLKGMLKYIRLPLVNM